jgi:hypothetical protein
MSKTKSKKKTSKPIEVVVVLDRSGSMQSMRTDAVGGYNAFVEEQKKESGECRFSLLQFDDEHEIVYEGVPVADVEALTEETFVPRGTTALRDAVARGVAILTGRVKKGVLGALAILTDGHENSSTEISAAGLKSLLADCETKGWGIMYLGANQDAVEVGAAMGINPARAATFAGDNVKDAYAAAGGNLRSFRGTGGDVAALSFSTAQRSSMTGGDDELVPPGEAARVLGISTSTLRRREDAGEGPEVTRPTEKGHRRYRRGALRDYLDR